MGNCRRPGHCVSRCQPAKGVQTIGPPPPGLPEVFCFNDQAAFSSVRRRLQSYECLCKTPLTIWHPRSAHQPPPPLSTSKGRMTRICPLRIIVKRQRTSAHDGGDRPHVIRCEAKPRHLCAPRNCCIAASLACWLCSRSVCGRLRHRWVWFRTSRETTMRHRNPAGWYSISLRA